MFDYDRRADGFFITFGMHPVHEDWKIELYNYFIKGYEPGSFHTRFMGNKFDDGNFNHQGLGARSVDDPIFFKGVFFKSIH